MCDSRCLHTVLSETRPRVRRRGVQAPGVSASTPGEGSCGKQRKKKKKRGERGDVRCVHRRIIIQPEDWKPYYSTAAVWLFNESIWGLRYWIKGLYLVFAEHSQYQEHPRRDVGYSSSCQSEKLSPSVMREVTLGLLQKQPQLSPEPQTNYVPYRAVLLDDWCSLQCLMKS